MSNRNLYRAKKAQNDEFYTQLSDIEKELKHYCRYFEGAAVYCNCDDPSHSNFVRYFQSEFSRLKLRKLVATGWSSGGNGLYYEYNGDEKGPCFGSLKGDGDFRSSECVELLKQADIVVTNPPFTLFREYVDLMVKYKKHFLIVGHIIAAGYKIVFPWIRRRAIQLGYTHPQWFIQPDGTFARAQGNTCWFTSMGGGNMQEDLIFRKAYRPERYPVYDNVDAIEVSRIEDIPSDYEGTMGVPVSFLMKWNPDQFEILGCSEHRVEDSDGLCGRDVFVGGRQLFRRIFIRNKKPRWVLESGKNGSGNRRAIIRTEVS